MSEQDFSWEMYESAFKADEETSREVELIERAMQDPVYTDAVQMALDAKLRIDLEGMTLEEARKEYESGSFFDKHVAHLINKVVSVSGTVVLYSIEDDNRVSIDQSEAVDGLLAVFKGFYIVEFNDNNGESSSVRPFITCGFEVSFNDEGEAVVPGADDATKIALLHGQPAEVQLDFGMTSPQQAIAWLHVNAPNIIEQIDKKILWQHDPFEVKALTELMDYEIYPKEYVGSENAELRLCAAVAYYLNGVMSFNGKIPYRVDIDGPVNILNEENGQLEPVVIQSRNRLFGIESLVPHLAYGDDEQKEYKIAAYGTLHAAKAGDESKEGVLIHLEDLKNIRSIR